MQHRTARVRSGRLQADQLRSGNPSSAQVRSGQLYTYKSTELSSAEVSTGRVNSASVSSAQVSAGQLRSAQLLSAQLQTASLRPGQHLSVRKIQLRSARLRFNRDFPIPHVWLHVIAVYTLLTSDRSSSRRKKKIASTLLSGLLPVLFSALLPGCEAHSNLLKASTRSESSGPRCIRPAGPPYFCSAPRSEGLSPLVVLLPSRVELC